ncbi:hypothetical protein [Nonomuraea sp. KM88]|uniref:hypothetical protein n=1 Tax=Nonomuraea sp. KM88 TaxID=3457427 RepID=UPI003FCC6EBB
MALVNGRPGYTGQPGPALVFSAAVGLAVGAFAIVLVVSATTLIAAGRLLDRPVSPAGALRACLARWPALLGFVILGVVVGAAVLISSSLVTRPGPGRVFVVLLLGLVAMQGALTIPAVVLERQGLVGALARALSVASGKRLAISATLVAGMILPVLAVVGAYWMSDRVAVVVPATAIGLPLLLLTVPVQGAVLAVLFLKAVPEGELTALRDGLPGPGQAWRPRPPIALGGLLLPGLLLAGMAVFNPLSWQEITTGDHWEHTIDPRSGVNHTRLTWMDYDRDGIDAFAVGRDGRPSLVSGETQLICDDRRCREHRWATLESPGGEVFGAVSVGPGDGYFVARIQEPNLTSWLCDQRARCVPGTDLEVPGRTFPVLATDVGSDGRAVIAYQKNRPGHKDGLTLVTCRDPRCTDTTKGTTQDVDVEPIVDVAASANGRIIAAVAHRHKGTLSIHSCDLTECRKPIVINQVSREGAQGVEVITRPDGRPVVLYEGRNGPPTLVSCQSPDCARTDSARLPIARLHPTAPGTRPAPAVSLDRSGRVLVAGRQGTSIVLISCLGTSCTTRPIAAGDVFARPTLTRDHAGHLVIAWWDATGLHMATLHTRNEG